MKKVVSLASALSALIVVPQVFGQGFSYTAGDVYLGARQAGNPSDVLFDLGPVTDFLTGQYSSNILTSSVSIVTTKGGTDIAAALTSTFGSGLNNVNLSLFAANDTTIAVPQLWVTRSRSSADVQSTPWRTQATGSLSNTRTSIFSLGSGATLAAGQTGAVTSGGFIKLGAADANSYSTAIGGGDFGNFQGNIEVTTSGSIALADFYQVDKSAGRTTQPAQFLGTFGVDSTGNLNYTPNGVPVVPEPSELGLAAAAAGLLWLGHAWSGRNRK
jgi:hypothetical protein